MIDQGDGGEGGGTTKDHLVLERARQLNSIYFLIFINISAHANGGPCSPCFDMPVIPT